MTEPTITLSNGKTYTRTQIETRLEVADRQMEIRDRQVCQFRPRGNIKAPVNIWFYLVAMLHRHQDIDSEMERLKKLMLAKIESKIDREEGLDFDIYEAWTATQRWMLSNGLGDTPTFTELTYQEPEEVEEEGLDEDFDLPVE